MKAIRKNSKVRKTTRKSEARFVEGLEVRGEIADDASDDDGSLPSGVTHVKTSQGKVLRKRFALA